MTTLVNAKASAKAASLSLLSRTMRSIRRRGKSMSGGLLQIALLTAILVSASGYFRPSSVDRNVAWAVAFVQGYAQGVMANGWLDPRIANAVVRVSSYGAFAGVLMIAASLIRRIPAYTGFLILSELNRRQGRNVSTLEHSLGLSMPIALAIALASTSVLSLYACIHVALCYAYIRLSNDSRRVDGILNWYVKVRTPMDSGAEPDEAEDE